MVKKWCTSDGECVPGERGGVMLVFWDEALVFLAVPKTGTTALQVALTGSASVVFRKTPKLKHVTATTYRTNVLPLLGKFGHRNFETIAVIREPISWLGSWYRYRQRDAIKGTSRSTQGISFDDFVQAAVLAEPPGFAAVGSQARFLTDEDGNLAVTHLFRYERMDDLVAFLEQRLNIALSLPRLNVSPAAGLTLTATTEARLRNLHAAEFALWDQVPALLRG